MLDDLVDDLHVGARKAVEDLNRHIERATEHLPQLPRLLGRLPPAAQEPAAPAPAAPGAPRAVGV
ncbi:MAG: hypothetical protein HY744_21630 [Deltaproteobacteria bacterium]|nr:hypothetical protein [Deltaproteobacteria bacterium]